MPNSDLFYLKKGKRKNETLEVQVFQQPLFSIDILSSIFWAIRDEVINL